MENIKQGTIFIGFASQKGGVGKSTLAEILATILYYEKGFKLFVVDCDETQKSFQKLRSRERQAIENNAQLTQYTNNFFTERKIKPYKVLGSSVKHALDIALEELEAQRKKQEKIDIVIFDFPGHVASAEIFNLSLDMDFILSPLEQDVQSLTSSIAYAVSTSNMISKLDSSLKHIFLFWNKINKSANEKLRHVYSKHIEANHQLEVFDSILFQSVKFSKELAEAGLKDFCRSTFFPPSKRVRLGTGIDDWVDEVIQRLKLNELLKN